MSTNGLDIEDLTDNVQLKNRIVDGRVTVTYNSRAVIWEPGQIKTLPRKVAEWFRHKSMFRFNPGDHNEGISPKWEYKLAILEDATQDSTDLTKDYVAGVKELLDVSNMPQLTRVDKDGHPLRRVYIDPRSTGAMSKSDVARRVEEQAVRQTSSAIVHAAAEEIADAAQGASDADIEAAVNELTGANG